MVYCHVYPLMKHTPINVNGIMGSTTMVHGSEYWFRPDSDEPYQYVEILKELPGFSNSYAQYHDWIHVFKSTIGLCLSTGHLKI